MDELRQDEVLLVQAYRTLAPHARETMRKFVFYMTRFPDYTQPHPGIVARRPGGNVVQITRRGA